jgi:hypothetical protein
VEVSQEEILAKIEDAVFRIEKTGKQIEEFQRESLKLIKGIYSMLIFFTVLVVISLIPTALGLIFMLFRK